MSPEQYQKTRRTRRVVKRPKVRTSGAGVPATHGAGGQPVGGRGVHPAVKGGGNAVADGNGKTREEELKEDYLEIARRYEEQMLYEDSLKYFRKAGSMPDVARVKDRMEGLYEKKAEEFKNRGKYAEAARLYAKLGNIPEADRMKALAREHGDFLMEDVAGLNLGGEGGPGDGGDAGEGGGMDGGEGGPAPSGGDDEGWEKAASGDVGGESAVRDITGMAGGGGSSGGREFVTEEGVRVLEVKRGRSVSDMRGAGTADGERHFSFCPYCGERISLPKPPAFCPFCGDRF